MLNRLNQQIIENLENLILEHKSYRQIFLYKLRFLLYNYIWISFILLLSISYLHNPFIKATMALWMIGLFFVVFFNFLTLNEELEDISNEYKKYILLDIVFIFDKKNRHNKLKAFKEANFKKVIERKLFFCDMPCFYENLELSLWTEKYVRQESAVVNFFVQRYGNQKVAPLFNKRLLFWSQIIPLNILDSNNLRTLLAICPVINEQLIAHYSLEQLNQKQLEEIFSKYDNRNLFLLFTNDFNINDYFKVISIASSCNLVLPVYKNINQLVTYLIEVSSFKKFKKTDFCDIVIKNNTYEKIDQIYSIEDLIKLSEYFKNCIMQLKNSLSSGANYLFVIYKDSKPDIVFQVNNKYELIEAKKRFNEQLDIEDLNQLKTYIDNCLIELKLRKENKIKVEL
jgi:hypothetical protein